MTLIIEDGSIVANANSYVTTEEYMNWADARFGGSRSTGTTCVDDLEGFILRATDYFESQNLIGTKVSSAQPMQWPRQGAYIDGFYVSSSSIPNEVKASIFELAYTEEQGNSELGTVERAVKKEKVASIEVEYSDNASSSVFNRSVPNALKKLLQWGGQNRVFRV